MTTPIIKLEGTRDLVLQLDGLSKSARNELAKAIWACALYVQSLAVKSIQQGGRGGKIYNRRSIQHQASAAGEPPKSDTGNLVKNITSKKDGELNVSVGSRAPAAGYGFFLELGTSRMKPRPWLQPALMNSMDFIQQRIAEAWRSATESNGVK